MYVRSPFGSLGFLSLAFSTSPPWVTFPAVDTKLFGLEDIVNGYGLSIPMTRTSVLIPERGASRHTSLPSQRHTSKCGTTLLQSPCGLPTSILLSYQLGSNSREDLLTRSLLEETILWNIPYRSYPTRYFARRDCHIGGCSRVECPFRGYYTEGVSKREGLWDRRFPHGQRTPRQSTGHDKNDKIGLIDLLQML